MNTEMKQEAIQGYATTAIVSSRVYNIAIGIFLFWGFLFSDFIMMNLETIFRTIPFLSNTWALLLFYFGLTFGGQFVMVKAKNIGIRLIGYHMVLFAISILLGIIISAYTGEVVVKAMGVCASIAVLMTALAVLFPSFFEKLGRTLFVALIAGVLMTFLFGVIFRADITIIDGFMVLVFSGFIGYDWVMAQKYPMTLGNAVFAASTLYIDIVNILIRLLRIFGKKD